MIVKILISYVIMSLFLFTGCATNAADAGTSNDAAASTKTATKVETATKIEAIKITNRGPAFFVNDNFQPTIQLKRGVTYLFEVNAPGHPFWIKTAESWGQGNAYTNGVNGNGTAAGTVRFTVPLDAPDLLFYNCEVHPNMHGRIEIAN